MSASSDRGHYERLVLKHCGEMLVFEPYETMGLIAFCCIGLGKALIKPDIAGADDDEKRLEEVIRTRANKVEELARYVLCQKIAYERRLRKVQYRIRRIAQKRIDFGGILGVERPLDSKDPPSTFMHTRRNNSRTTSDKEPQLVHDDHYKDSGLVRLHSISILDEIYISNCDRVFNRVRRANSLERMVTAFEFEDLVVVNLTRPESNHCEAPTIYL